MSATNRSDARKSHKFDYYQTPEWIIENLFDYLSSSKLNDHKFILSKLKHGSNLDPCAGGSKSETDSTMPYFDLVKSRFENSLTTMDIREDSLAEIKGDFLSLETEKRYDVIISNPPFNKAEEFIEKSYELLKDDGFIIFLLRIGFLGSKKRFDLFSNYQKVSPPRYIFLHHKRPSFTSDGGTDSDYYAHMVFSKSELVNYNEHQHSNFYII